MQLLYVRGDDIERRLQLGVVLVEMPIIHDQTSNVRSDQTKRWVFVLEPGHEMEYLNT